MPHPHSPHRRAESDYYSNGWGREEVAMGTKRSSRVLAGLGVVLVAATLSACSRDEDARILRARGSSGSDTLSLVVSACVEKWTLDVAEESTRVRVRVTAHPSGNAGADCAMGILVLLREPLGSRELVDTTTGKAVKVEAPA